MVKNKIILIDIDEDFIQNLELKLLKSFNKDIELESITDNTFLKQNLNNTINADVLVVNEAMFFKELQNQDIKNIVLLTEQNDNFNDKYRTIYKYTSLEEISNAIIKVFDFGKKNEDNSEAIVAVVCSASGGAGKSTVALGISSAISKTSMRVLYINAQQINIAQQFFYDKTPISRSLIGRLLNKTEDIGPVMHSTIRSEEFDYLPPFSLSLTSLGLDNNIYLKIIDYEKKSHRYDLIVVDTDTVFDENLLNLITLSDKTIIVYNNTKNSIFATNSLLKNVKFDNKDKCFFVCNNYIESLHNKNILNECNFPTSEYIKAFENYESMSIEDISNQLDIKKVSYLII